MNKLKHNKLRNTALIFEILTRISVREVMETKPTHSIRIIKKHFNPNSQLHAELKLYEMLTKKHQNVDVSELLEMTLVSHRKNLDIKQLNEEKFNLIRSIKRSYDIDDFFSNRVSNYKLLASAYKLFEYRDTNLPIDYVQAKTLVLECMSGRELEKTISEPDKIIQEVGDPKLLKLTLKIIVEKFNEKYKGLTAEQKTILSKFITEDTASESFKSFIYKEVAKVNKTLNSLRETIKDAVLQIKLKEAITLTSEIVKSPIVKEEHISALLKYHELINTLRG